MELGASKAKHTTLKSTNIFHCRQARAENFQFFNVFDQAGQNRRLHLHQGCTATTGQKQNTPEVAEGHNTLAARTKTVLASMGHERTDPPPEEPALRAVPLCGLLWWRNLSPPACPVRTLMRHAGEKRLFP